MVARPALHLAAKRGNEDRLKELLAQPQYRTDMALNRLDQDGRTALHWAAACFHVLCVKVLTAAGADVNKLNSEGLTPLCLCAGPARDCHRPRQKVTAMLLLRAGASTDVTMGPHREGWPLLTEACISGAPDVVRLLLWHGANVEATDDNGHTSMATACHVHAKHMKDSPRAGDYFQVIEALAAHGAQRTFEPQPERPAWGRTAEGIATHFGDQTLLAYLDRTRRWTTPLHYIEHLNRDRALELLRKGADAKAGEPGFTPLDRAKGMGPLRHPARAAHVILEAGAPWGKETHRFYSPEVRGRAAELVMFYACLTKCNPRNVMMVIPLDAWYIIVRYCITYDFVVSDGPSFRFPPIAKSIYHYGGIEKRLMMLEQQKEDRLIDGEQHERLRGEALEWHREFANDESNWLHVTNLSPPTP